VTGSRRLLPFLLLLLAAWLTVPAAFGASIPAAERRGTVTWVYDADTLRVEPHGRVRLIGIDAPEKAASARDRAFTSLGIAPGRLRPVYAAGLDWSIRNVKGQTVTLRPGQPERDRHGRLLAYVLLADGRLLNRLLLEEGLVIVYRRAPFPAMEDFLAAEAAARQRSVGLWSD
jgi:micrococcal nuclease